MDTVLLILMTNSIAKIQAFTFMVIGCSAASPTPRPVNSGNTMITSIDSRPNGILGTMKKRECEKE
jgi:hypothetical protein